MTWRKILKNYFISISIVLHCLLISVLVYKVSGRALEYWRWKRFEHFLAGQTDKEEVYQIETGNHFNTLPRGRWIKIHQQKVGDQVQFSRQSTAGCAYDNNNQRMLVFGSDIHGKNWDNSIHFFDLSSLKWFDEYPADEPETYKVNEYGYITAGPNNRPGAMQIFGAMAYDDLHQRLVVASSIKRDGYGGILRNLWPSEEKKPTWVYEFSSKRWNAYIDHSIDFRPYKLVFDANRRVIVGFKPNGIFEWGDDYSGWKKVAERTYQAWNTNAVFDSTNNVFLLYGGSNRANDIYAYKAGQKSAEIMPTPGIRPPVGEAIPLAFHRKIEKMVALVESGQGSQTWLYDYKQDNWKNLEQADFPYPIGMNYCMGYDAKEELLVLVSSPPMEPVSVWVLRI